MYTVISYTYVYISHIYIYTYTSNYNTSVVIPLIKVLAPKDPFFRTNASAISTKTWVPPAGRSTKRLASLVNIIDAVTNKIITKKVLLRPNLSLFWLIICLSATKFSFPFSPCQLLLCQVSNRRRFFPFESLSVSGKLKKKWGGGGDLGSSKMAMFVLNVLGSMGKPKKK